MKNNQIRRLYTFFQQAKVTILRCKIIHTIDLAAKVNWNHLCDKSTSNVSWKEVIWRDGTDHCPTKITPLWAYSKFTPFKREKKPLHLLYSFQRVSFTHGNTSNAEINIAIKPHISKFASGRINLSERFWYKHNTHRCMLSKIFCLR